MHQKSVAYRGNSVYYKTAGQGKHVMLIHGFGEDSDIWKYQVEYLKGNYSIIIPDLPGSGKSEFLSIGHGQSSATFGIYASILRKMLDQENVQVCTIIGHSMGGYVALAFSQQYPERLNGLGLFHSTAFADSDEKKKNRRKGIEFIQRYGAQEFLKQSIPNLFGEKFTNEHPGKVKELIDRSGNFTGEVLVHYYEAMINRPDRTATLKKITNPVLFIVGEQDKSVSLLDSLKQCYLPILVQINILPGVAHMGMWEQKDQANNTVMKFLNYVHDA